MDSVPRGPHGPDDERLGQTPEPADEEWEPLLRAVAAVLEGWWRKAEREVER